MTEDEIKEFLALGPSERRVFARCQSKADWDAYRKAQGANLSAVQSAAKAQAEELRKATEVRHPGTGLPFSKAKKAKPPAPAGKSKAAKQD